MNLVNPLEIRGYRVLAVRRSMFQEEKVGKLWSKPWHGWSRYAALFEILNGGLLLLLRGLNAPTYHAGSVVPNYLR